MRLKGKITLITGASRGIGRGIAEVFADEGADVAVNYVASAQQAEEVARSLRDRGRRAIAVKADVAARSDVEAMVDTVWKELGPIDVLVNNAAILYDTWQNAVNADFDTVNQAFRTNLFGPWRLTQK